MFASTYICMNNGHNLATDSTTILGNLLPESGHYRPTGISPYTIHSQWKWIFLSCVCESDTCHNFYCFIVGSRNNSTQKHFMDNCKSVIYDIWTRLIIYVYNNNVPVAFPKPVCDEHECVCVCVGFYYEVLFFCASFSCLFSLYILEDSIIMFFCIFLVK